jgi:hypothetical protein
MAYISLPSKDIITLGAYSINELVVTIMNSYCQIVDELIYSYLNF